MPCRHHKLVVRYLSEVEPLQDYPIHRIVPSFAICSPSDKVEASNLNKPRGNLITPCLAHRSFSDQNCSMGSSFHLRQRLIRREVQIVQLHHANLRPQCSMLNLKAVDLLTSQTTLVKSPPTPRAAPSCGPARPRLKGAQLSHSLELRGPWPSRAPSRSSSPTRLVAT